jgi:transcriptional regulator with XRE-family HTH domain
MHLSTNIKHLRKSLGWNQTELAERLEVKNATISGYENGTAKPSIMVLLKMAKIFTVSIDSLIYSDLSDKDAEYTIDKAEEPQPFYEKDQCPDLLRMCTRRVKELEGAIYAYDRELAASLDIQRE